MSIRVRLKCLFWGHAWNACQCTNCGSRRDVGHMWVSLGFGEWCMCHLCYTKRQHAWNGCGCTFCGARRHKWGGGNCPLCGTPTCARCQGAGWYSESPLDVPGKLAQIRTDCTACQGTGERRIDVEMRHLTQNPPAALSDRSMVSRTRAVRCSMCRGTGSYTGPPLGVRGNFPDQTITCPYCGGVGETTQNVDVPHVVPVMAAPELGLSVEDLCDHRDLERTLLAVRCRTCGKILERGRM
jgi:hypothetical protein